MTTRKTCRICGSKLKPILSLGNLCVSTFVDDPKQCKKAPLELVLCENKDCGLLQLKHTINMDEMYRHYWYKSSLNKDIVDDLEDIVKKAQKEIKFKKGDVWLDVGSNDSTLLKAVSKKYIKVGCEPALNFREDLKKHTDKYINDYWNYEAYERFCIKKAKIITSIGCFYDMENPCQFIADVKKALADDGIFIAQMMTLKQMIENNDIGNITWEHLEYYDYKSLVYLYEKNGLEIYKVEENKINGGSYRLYARHYMKGSVKHKEPKVDYKAFAKRIEENKKRTLELIKGKKVCLYGASTKGNTIAQYYELGKHIRYAVDKSAEKLGKFMVGSNIKIIHESRLNEFDYALVMPYGFIELFKKKEKEWLKKGKFIVPFPKPKIV